MDVGDPSNFPRVQALYGNDRDALKADFSSFSHTDQKTRDMIKETYNTKGYILDPHTAVGVLGLQCINNGLQNSPKIVLATAHPYKFSEIVEPLVGAVPIPKNLINAVGREAKNAHQVDDPTLKALKDILLNLK